MRWVKTSGVSPPGWLARSRILARISGPGEYRHDVVADAPRQSRRHVGNGQGAAQACLIAESLGQQQRCDASETSRTYPR
jgi:hypothetical protein